jgi:vacuolar ATPase assembly integral membrane protein VMA21
VLGKLIIFSILVLTTPILVYFGTVKEVGSTFAGIYAAVTANVVLIAYIVMAFNEPDELSNK